MPALLTHHDRKMYALRIEIEKLERWIFEDQGDRRAVAFHRARIAELRSERKKLEEGAMTTTEDQP
jgi:hypothetical protein